MPKIVLIGAGSHVFSKNLITDILTYPELRDSVISLVDINTAQLELITDFAKELVSQYHFPTKIESTTNRREALDGADYVFITIRVGSQQEIEGDLDITAKYGIDEAVGDTIGPAGVFYGARHVPVILDICHDMEELCPDAWLLNYSNPMAIITWAIQDYSRVKSVGLCHSVKNTAGDLARYMGVPFSEIAYWVAGINHMAWFLELKWRGQDAYPILRGKFKDPWVYSKPDAHWAGPDNVRVEVFKAFGLFNTESSKHMSEYVPYFRKRPELFKQFNLLSSIECTKYFNKQREKEYENFKQEVLSKKKLPLTHSGEYGSEIIYSIETGSPIRINANVKNSGLITNLPDNCCVEVPCLVDNKGITPCYIGDLPPQCAALNRSNISVQELAVQGIVEKDKTKIFQAILLDPLTSAVLTIDQTRQMVDEMFQWEARYFVGYK
jgi:alpha-galactosidase